MTASQDPEPVAVVTGASRGIGRAIAVTLGARGYRVVCVARGGTGSVRTSARTLEETAALTESVGGTAWPYELDLRDAAGVESLIDDVYETWGRCDLLVNNAAVAFTGKAVDLPLSRWRVATAVNVDAPFAATRRVISQATQRSQAARVLNISSLAAIWPGMRRISYSVTKAALESLSVCMALEGRGVAAVNCLRIDRSVWSEGFADTLGEAASDLHFEHPRGVCEAVLLASSWPVQITGRVDVLSVLRQTGQLSPASIVDASRPPDEVTAAVWDELRVWLSAADVS